MVLWVILTILAASFLVAYLRNRSKFWDSHANSLAYEESLEEAEEDHFDWLNNRGIYANGKGKPPDCKVCGK